MTSQMTLRSMLIAALLSSVGLAACESIEERMEREDAEKRYIVEKYQERSNAGDGHSD